MTKSDAVNLRLPVAAIRAAAFGMLVIGVYFFLRQLPNVLDALVSYHGGDWLRNLARTVFALGGALTYCAWGCIAYAATQISFGKPKRRMPFDFEAQLGQHIFQERTGQAWNRRLTGVFCIIGAMLLGLVGGAIRRGFQRADVPWIFGIIFFVLGLCVTYWAILVCMSGLRQLAPRAESVLRNNPRRPILFLRSFKKDVRGMDRGLGHWLRLFFLGPFGLQTTEQSLALAVKSFRPMVAIGQPGQRLPPLGAPRLYVAASSAWKEVVSELIDASDFVILRIGATRGFWWEIEHLVEKCDPRRVLIYLPKQDRNRGYSAWRVRAAEFLPHPLPYHPRDAMFLGFGPNWEPILHGAGKRSLGSLLRLPFGGRAPQVRAAFNAAARQLGANPTPLPLLAREWFFYPLFALILLWLFL